ncbi:hypothetical protein [Desulfovibrio gilichinskyi]|uniref:Uncharacterized protein n=1 Tax=Desulfovibrio gilichinskyi TaxID=1519643 RepID=A0A1X7CVG3_9BACT|nr:hypothetical protein [Desulfovibrio gilichinskyi]SMF03920.1 hypothetical protein SAMN06295933_1319 [Desulfovibrio gilichinskyi]
MTDSINSISYGTQPYSAEYSKKQDEQIESLPDQNQSKKKDTIRISAEALNMYNKSTEEEAVPANSWEKLFDLKSGSTTLANGNKQIVKIEGSKLEIYEYHDDKLVKSVHGELSADSAVLETEIYDKAGKLNQSIKTNLQMLKNDGSKSAARVEREITWYQNGQVSRRMNDRMSLESAYKDKAEGQIDNKLSNMFANFTDAQSTDINDLIARSTTDKHSTKYIASVQEFLNGHISKNINIDNSADFINQTNRPSRIEGDSKSGKTNEIKNSNNLKITIQNYDSKGEILRESYFDSKHVDDPRPKGGKLKQTMSVSWYNQGKLVKKSSGSMTMKEAESKKLPPSATLLETLNMDEKDYATGRAKTATELLGKPLMESSSNAGFYSDIIEEKINKGSFDSVENIAKYGEDVRPYEVSWENEIYKDGKLAARQVDTESAKENNIRKKYISNRESSLVEDYSAPTLHKTSHLDESYDKNEVLKKQASIESRESIKEVKNGDDILYTQIEATQDLGNGKQYINQRREGKLEEFDSQANTASKGMSKEIGLTLDDSRTLLNSLDYSK